MTRPARWVLAPVCAGLLAATGCATLVRGSSQSITVNTQPPGAACEFLRGTQVAAVASPTPQTVTVEKSRVDVTVVCRKPGYLEARGPIRSEFQGWTFGNIIFGGLIGVAIDAGSGAMHDYPQSFTVTLIPAAFPTAEAREAFFERLRAEVRKQAADAVQQVEKRCQGKTECAAQTKKVDAYRDERLAELDRQLALVAVVPE